MLGYGVSAINMLTIILLLSSLDFATVGIVLYKYKTKAKVWLMLHLP